MPGKIPVVKPSNPRYRGSVMAEVFPDRAPPCLRCLHFYVTFNPSFPRGCRMFGVQTAAMPSQEVYLATGRHCPQFQENPKIKKT